MADRLLFYKCVRALNGEHAFRLQLLGGYVNFYLAQPRQLSDLGVGQRFVFYVSAQDPEERQC
jgi:hypothetical protein